LKQVGEGDGKIQDFTLNDFVKRAEETYFTLGQDLWLLTGWAPYLDNIGLSKVNGFIPLSIGYGCSMLHSCYELCTKKSALREFIVGAHAQYSGSNKWQQQVCYGAVMCFFGGKYQLIFAFNKALNIHGRGAFMSNVNTIMHELHQIERAFVELLTEDKDGDGQADVEQVGLYVHSPIYMCRTIYTSSSSSVGIFSNLLMQPLHHLSHQLPPTSPTPTPPTSPTPTGSRKRDVAKDDANMFKGVGARQDPRMSPELDGDCT
jgi:hypothetical protein